MANNLIRREDLKIGLELPGVTREITQEHINAYARASGDMNPIHIDPDFARKTPLGGTIAHGMMVAAYLSQMLAASLGEVWLTSGRLSIRFRLPARPGDIITAAGTLNKLESPGDAIIARFDVYCQNQKGEQVISGEAAVKL